MPVAQASATARIDSAPSGVGPLIVATDRCKGCELCVAACPTHVLALDAGRVNALGHHPVRLLYATRCTSCALCAKVCPDSVFTVIAPARDARA